MSSILAVKSQLNFWRWKLRSQLMDVRRFVFTRVIPIAVECEWCERLMPVEFSKMATHLRHIGRAHVPTVLCTNCRGRESIWEAMFGDPMFDDDDYEFEGTRYLGQCAICGGEVYEDESSCDCDDGPIFD